MARIDLARRAEIYAEKRSRTQAALVGAAIVVFSEKGLDGATTEDLIREAGVSRGTFYNYFTDMDDVVESVATMLVEDLSAEIAARLRGEAAADVLLAGTLAAYLCKACADRNWGGVVAHLALKNAPQPVGATTALGLDRILKKGLAEGVFRFRQLAVARDLVMGASLYALKTVVDAPDDNDYIVTFLEHILLALGTAPKRAHATALKAIASNAAPRAV